VAEKSLIRCPAVILCTPTINGYELEIMIRNQTLPHIPHIFMVCSKNIYILLYSAGEYSSACPLCIQRLCGHLSIDSSCPRPQALGDDHATDAMPKTRLGDGCTEESQLREQGIKGLSLRLFYSNNVE
jgi:hypothetical protein